MTPTERRHALDAIGWSARELGRRLDWSENMTRRWLEGRHQTALRVDEWLRRLAGFHEKHPGPSWAR